MLSLIMLSFIYCDQTDPYLPSPKWLSLRYFIPEEESLVVIIRLMLSLSLCPKVITLSGFHYTCIHYKTLGLLYKPVS
jgi:hypothetical protein